MSIPTSNVNTLWAAIWDALIVEAKKVTGLSDSNVYQGLRFPPAKDVCVMIAPPDIRQIAQESGQGTYYHFPTQILVFAKDANMVVGMKEAMAYAGAVVAEIMDDRELGGLVEVVEDENYVCNPPDVPGYERQLVLITVTPKQWLDTV